MQETRWTQRNQVVVQKRQVQQRGTAAMIPLAQHPGFTGGGPRTAHLTSAPEGAVSQHGPSFAQQQQAQQSTKFFTAPIVKFIAQHHFGAQQSPAGYRFFPETLPPGVPQTAQGIACTGHGQARTVTVTARVNYTGPLFSLDPVSGLRVPVEIRLSDTSRVHILNGNQSLLPKPAQLPRDSITGEPLMPDLDHVSISTCHVKHYRNDTSALLQVAMNFEHHAFRDADREMLDLQASRTNVLVGHFLEMEPLRQQDCKVYAFKVQSEMSPATNQRVNYHYLNPAFISMCGRISLESLHNGIIELPPAVRAEAGLPIWQANWDANERFKNDPDPEVRAQYESNVAFFQSKPPEHRTSSWFLVPANHVLAWELNTSDAQRQAKGIYSRELRDKYINNAQSASPVMYHVVSDVNLRYLVEAYGKAWFNRVDDRRVGDVGFYVMPLRTAAHQVLPEQGTFSFHVNLSYVCWPRMSQQQLASLAPSLSPEFPPLALFMPNIYDSANKE